MLQEVKCPSDSETQGSTLISLKVGFRLQVLGLQTISQKQLIILCCKKLWWVERVEHQTQAEHRASGHIFQNLQTKHIKLWFRQLRQR